MKELKCPKCGNVFQVDEADYASIVSQVKNAEFDAELNRRLAELSKNQKAEQDLVTARTEQQYQSALNRKDLDIKEKESIIAQLRNELHVVEEKKTAEIKLAIADKEKEIAALHSSIRDDENKMQIAVMNEQRKALERIKDKDEEIAENDNLKEKEEKTPFITTEDKVNPKARRIVNMIKAFLVVSIGVLAGILIRMKRKNNEKKE